MLFAGCAQQHLTRRSGFKLVFSAFCAQYARAGESDLARGIPQRPADAFTGSQFAEAVSGMSREEREIAILEQLVQGNVPQFLRKLVPVTLNSATVFVMPEYLAIGSDGDFLRIPMNFHTAMEIARRFGFILPTKKIVDAIYNQSASRFAPQPLPAGPEMTSTKYYRMHNAMIDAQSRTRGFAKDALVAGHKKDVVLTNRLTRIAGRIAIYGWHRAPGMPIQPLSTVHEANYADYSHGIRLVASTALVDGKAKPTHEILENPTLSSTLSDEGAIAISSISA